MYNLSGWNRLVVDEYALRFLNGVRFRFNVHSKWAWRTLGPRRGIFPFLSHCRPLQPNFDHEYQ